MANFHRLELERWAPLTKSAKDASEKRFWSKFKGHLKHGLSAACTGVAWAPGETRGFDGSPVLRLACCVSLNVELFGHSLRSPTLAKTHKTLARTSDVCYGVSWRMDGKLLSMGDAGGAVYIVDATTGSILRAMNKKKKKLPAARCTAWNEAGSVLSGSDSGQALLWDVSSGTRISSFDISTDVEVRCVAATGRSQWLVGSYDGQIYVIDDRTETPQATFKHGVPVEALAVDGDAVASAGGTAVCVWDSSKCLQRWDTAHAKTVTSVAFQGHRVISGGLDGYVTSHSLLDPGSHVKVTDDSAAVLGVGFAGDESRLAVVRSDGSLLIKATPPAVHPQRKKPLEPPKGTFRHWTRGQGVRPDVGDGVVVNVTAEEETSRRKKPKKLPAYDEALRKFRYADALDEALATRDPIVVVSVLRELSRRGGLRTAVDRRDEDRIEPLLAFLATHLANPRYAPTLLDVAHTTLDLYADAIGRVPDVDDLFAKLRATLQNEIQNQLALLQLQGRVAGLLAAVPHPPSGGGGGLTSADALLQPWRSRVQPHNSRPPPPDVVTTTTTTS